MLAVKVRFVSLRQVIVIPVDRLPPIVSAHRTKSRFLQKLLEGSEIVRRTMVVDLFAPACPKGEAPIQRAENFIELPRHLEDGNQSVDIGQGNSWRFMREGLWIQPFWAFYWLFPGWLIRKWAKLTAH